MAWENGTWDSSGSIGTWQDLVAWINQVGFLPLFRNELPGFSVEEHTADGFWWSGDPDRDPWEWRQQIAGSGQVAYGKFFAQKAGFISRDWFPRFANWRRDGYDFDSRWDEELASLRQKRIMDQFLLQDQWLSTDLKSRAGFGKGGEKNFEGTVTDLQMGGYLLIRDFRRRRNRQGLPYGWPISVYATPEALWGYDHISSAYGELPQASRAEIFRQVRRHFPAATESSLRAVLGWKGERV